MLSPGRWCQKKKILGNVVKSTHLNVAEGEYLGTAWWPQMVSWVWRSRQQCGADPSSPLGLVSLGSCGPVLWIYHWYSGKMIEPSSRGLAEMEVPTIVPGTV